MPPLDTPGPAFTAVQDEPALAPTLAISTAAQAFATASVLALASIPTIVARETGIAAHAIGYQVSLIYCAGMIVSAFAGGLVKRFGSARVAQGALFVAAAGLLGLASGVLPAMLAGSVLIGCGYGCTNPSASHILKRVTPPRLRNLIYSIKQAGVPVGGVMAALLMPLLATHIGWRGALAVFAAATALLALGFQPLRPSWDTDRDRRVPVVGSLVKNQKLLWSAPGLRALALLGLLYSALQLCVSAFTVAMLIEEFGWSPLLAGTMAASVQVCGAVGRIVWGLVADWVRSGFAVLSGLGAAMAVCCGLLALGPALPAAATVLILCAIGLCAVGWNGVLLAETARLSPGRQGTLTGEVLVYTFFGVMIGPSGFSALYAHVGSYAATFGLFGVVALAGTVIAAFAHRAAAA
jgi:MFS family permease